MLTAATFRPPFNTQRRRRRVLSSAVWSGLGAVDKLVSAELTTSCVYRPHHEPVSGPPLYSLPSPPGFLPSAPPSQLVTPHAANLPSISNNLATTTTLLSLASPAINPSRPTSLRLSSHVQHSDAHLNHSRNRLDLTIAPYAALNAPGPLVTGSRKDVYLPLLTELGQRIHG